MFRRGIARYCSSGPLATPIHTLPGLEAGSVVTIRGRIEKARVKGKLGFLQLRQPPLSTVQCVVSVGSDGNKDLLAAAKALTPESVVEIRGKITIPEKLVQSATCQTVEIATESITTISAAQTPLPFPLKDTTTKLDTRLDHRPFDLRTLPNAAIFRLQSQATQYFRRYLLQKGFVEIHTPKLIGTPSEGGSQVFKLDYFGKEAYLAQSPQLFKQMAVQGDLTKVMEIGPVFRAENSQTHRHLTEYTGLDAEMIITGGSIPSSTSSSGSASSSSPAAPGHYEVLEQLEATVVYMIQSLHAECADLIHAAYRPEDFTVAGGEPAVVAPGQAEGKKEVSEGVDQDAAGSPEAVSMVQLPHAIVPQVPTHIVESLGLSDDSNPSAVDLLGVAGGTDKYQGRVGTMECPVLRLTFDNAVRILNDSGKLSAAVENDNGAAASVVNDLNSAQEKELGKLIKQRYGVDLYIIDEYHLSARPFYTMPSPADGSEASVGGLRSRSFDMFLRGEEICSGAQRIHNVDLLLERAKECNVSTDLIKDYVDAFRYGSWPHGGYGIGLERFIMFFLGLPNIRMTSMFPRDPRRIRP